MTTDAVELPRPNYPMLVVLITDNVVDHSAGTIRWVVGQPHPFVPTMNVVRMFDIGDGVKIYSASTDGKTGMRDRVRIEQVRLIEEALPLNVFVDEMTVDEDGDDEPDEPEEPDETETPPPRDTIASPSANGQAPS